MLSTTFIPITLTHIREVVMARIQILSLKPPTSQRGAGAVIDSDASYPTDSRYTLQWLVMVLQPQWRRNSDVLTN